MKRSDYRQKVRKHYTVEYRLIGLLAAVFLLAGCTSDGNSVPNNTAVPDAGQQEVEDVPVPDTFDSEDVAILTDVNREDGILTFQNLEMGGRYELTYDGVTGFYDKYHETISAAQLAVGSVVEIRFWYRDKKLTELSLSDEYWCYEDVGSFEIKKSGKRMCIGKEEYKLSSDLFIRSALGDCELMDINSVDSLTVYGREHTIYSIVVDRGHGYLRLANDTYFIGGWIEVGQALIRPITENMVLTVPVGSYQIVISKDGTMDLRDVIIEQNKEKTIDIGDIEVETKYGKVMFVLNPSTADVYIDGSKTDCSLPVELSYGIHQLIVRADGYDTLTRYLKVGRDSAAVTVDLSKKDESEDDDSDESEDEDKDSGDKAGEEQKTDGNQSDAAAGTGSSTSSSNQEGALGEAASSTNSDSGGTGLLEPVDSNADIDTVGGDYLVYIDSPADVEVYVDGNYVGIAPISFTKKTGNYEVTLRKTGYQTRSYSLQIDQEDKDVHYSFSGLTIQE